MLLVAIFAGAMYFGARCVPAAGFTPPGRAWIALGLGLAALAARFGPQYSAYVAAVRRWI
jgi:hypothetical protein